MVFFFQICLCLLIYSIISYFRTRSKFCKFLGNFCSLFFSPLRNIKSFLWKLFRIKRSRKIENILIQYFLNKILGVFIKLFKYIFLLLFINLMYKSIFFMAHVLDWFPFFYDIRCYLIQCLSWLLLLFITVHILNSYKVTHKQLHSTALLVEIRIYWMYA